ncbi:hypothetical protein CRE_22349 [Caenorhabditis remanei]|uniref:Uncharacterized protein n=1 Tax=Caenorhabditis remanei TaxID=31234 RepID=E3ME95_CAERE|nr:hypothetical protein CRE_22349 [Caenorhabditis remanei]
MGWSLQATALLALFSLASASTIYSCLNGCQCDTGTRNPTIRCDNRNMTHFPLPIANPQKGFNFLALSCNNIQSLPDATFILTAYPDLHGIDIMGNAELNCSSLQSLEGKIATLSRCNYPLDPVHCLSAVNGQASDKQKSSCDQTCRSIKKLEELWDQIKKIAKQIDIENYLNVFAKALNDFAKKRT